MPKIPVKPLFLTNYLMQLGDDNYEAHLDTVRFVPSSSTQSWVGGDGKSFTASTIATWVNELGFAQDWVTPESLSQFLHENEGAAVEAKFLPMNGDPLSPTLEATVTITPGAIGGTVNQFAGTSVTLGCTRPEIVPPAGP